MSLDGAEPPHNPKWGLWSSRRDFGDTTPGSSARQRSSDRAWCSGRDEGRCRTVAKPLQTNALNENRRSVPASASCHNPRVGQFRTHPSTRGKRTLFEMRERGKQRPRQGSAPYREPNPAGYEARDLGRDRMRRPMWTAHTPRGSSQDSNGSSAVPLTPCDWQDIEALTEGRTANA